jgi:hypothetical protein
MAAATSTKIDRLGIMGGIRRREPSDTLPGCSRGCTTLVDRRS